MENNAMYERGKIARQAGIQLSATDTQTRNSALLAIARAMAENQERIIKANQLDYKKSQEEGLAQPLLKRLTFDQKKIQEIIDGIQSLVSLDDPIGTIQMAKELDNGLDLYRVTCPLGVVGVIFESRPDAFVQISTLCLKSGNAVLLKGGREAQETNRVLGEIILSATDTLGIPHGWLQNLESRQEVTELLDLDQYVDLIIPRGSNDFVKYIMHNSNIPVMGHADGICHVYLDKYADFKKGIDIAVDSKAQYVSVCNAEETLLIHRDIAQSILPELQKRLESAGVYLKGDAVTRTIIPIDEAVDTDWSTEYLDYILSIKVVDSMDDAIAHINTYGSGHTDAIITEDAERAKKFTTLVDSGCVFVNCSTRFSDGFRFGFGAEVGISTSKLHARGPVGLEGLLSYKYKLIGHGQIVSDYASGKAHFTHKKTNKACPL